MALTEEGLMFVPGLCSRWVRLPGGVKTHYVTAGETGPAVVLLHGGIVGSSGTAGWRHMAPFLAANGFRVYCPDQPAFGLTEDPFGFYKPGQVGQVDFLHDFTTALALDSFHLAGNSMGCVNTVNYVLAHPERVISYALIAGRVGDIVPDEKEAALLTEMGWRRPDLTVFDGSAESMRSLVSTLACSPDTVSDDLIEMRTLAANKHLEDWPKHAQAAFIEPDLDPNEVAHRSSKGRLDKITKPAIYLYGRQDIILPVDVGYLQEDALPNIQFFYPDETGHQGQNDQPDMFNAVFLEFFRNGKISRKTAEWAGVSTRRPPLDVVES